MKASKERSAIILAAGFGLRMVPINMDGPKALLSVNGEVLIERLIKQLKEAEIVNITIVVGYMKEKLAYLEDKYSVNLIENTDYSNSNNLYSLILASKYISNSFIVPSDIWCKENPFITDNQESYYIIYDVQNSTEKEFWGAMTGIAFIADRDAEKLRFSLETVAKHDDGKKAFWEASLYENQKLWLQTKTVPLDSVTQINTFEDLRKIDEQSRHLQSEAIDMICEVLSAQINEITEITALKKGMTNRSFLFSCKDEKYIMRIPGEGTDLLINREQEASVYKSLKDTGVCDDIVYINHKNGYKITKFIPNARTCDPNNILDLKKCMAKLRDFHNLELQVEHEFNVFEQINFYESLFKVNDFKSIYNDYDEIKEKIFSLSTYIERHIQKRVLSHIDAVPDNFLIFNEEKEEIRLIDWEYAGMQDPHIDIAMFGIYSLYDKEQIDKLIDIYFDNNCSKEIRLKIYCYVATCGLLWSNWCEYKRSLGVDFGEYAHRQYQYARDFTDIIDDSLQ
ncbi:NTP transferase domain-containing protein [Streptococcus merionis]|uniref:NTP transferase domain-containing protein n=1 Tax=Streptococcus merionis TaxID=400065 RepID=UPI003511324B